MATHPIDPEPSTPTRPHLTLLPPAVSESSLASPPDITTDDVQADREPAKSLPPLPVDIELGGTAYPDFLGANHRMDTAWSGQPHWLSDAKGEPFTFRLNANLSRLVSMIVEHPGTPYRTKSDFFRDAAYYLAVAVRDLVNIQDPRMINLMREADARSAADYESTLQEEVLAFEHAMTDSIIGALERGALAEACRQLCARWADVQDMTVRHRREAHERAIRDSILMRVVILMGLQRGLDVPTAALPAAS